MRLGHPIPIRGGDEHDAFTRLAPCPEFSAGRAEVNQAQLLEAGAAGREGKEVVAQRFAAPSPRLIPEGENRIPLSCWRGFKIKGCVRGAAWHSISDNLATTIPI